MGPGRGRGERPHGARHLRARRRRTAAAGAHRGTQCQKIVAAPGGGDRLLPVGEAESGPVLRRRRRRRSPPGARVQAHYGCPQDVEWALNGTTLSLVQTRPITTLADAEPPARARRAAVSRCSRPGRLTRTGDRARPRPAPARRRPSVVDGEVLVAPLTNPDWVPAVRRAAALVTDSGGMTCHAAIVARELGVPAVVGTRSGTRTLATACGHGRRHHRPGLAGAAARGRAPARPPVGSARSAETIATGLYVNLATPRTRARSRRCRGRRRAAAGGVPAHRGAGDRHPPTSRPRGGRAVRDRDRRRRSARSRGVPSAPGRLPGRRPAQQRVPGPVRRGGLRAARGQPDDRLPGLLPLRARPVVLPARARRAGPRPRGVPGPAR